MGNSPSTVDYDALAKQYGAVSSQPAGASAPVDYDALAKQHGAISSEPSALTLDDVVGHPEFQAMSLRDKNAFLMESVPEFAKRAPKDRAELLNSIHYGAPEEEKPSEGAQREPSFGAKLWKRLNEPPEFLRESFEDQARSKISSLAGRYLPPRVAGPAAFAANIPASIIMAPPEAARKMATPLSFMTAGTFPAAEALGPTTSLVAKGLGVAGGIYGGEQGAEQALTPRERGETGAQEFERRVGGAGQTLLGVGAGAASLTAPAPQGRAFEPVQPRGALAGRTLGRAGNAIAERTAQSMIGPEERGTPFVSRPAPAMVAEGPLALTRGGLIKKLGNALDAHQAVLERTLDASKNATPEPLRPIVERATQAEIDRASAAGHKSVASAIEKWRDDYLEGKPESVSLSELYDLRKKLGQDKGIFKSAQATREDIGLDQAQREVYRAMNQALDRRMPGFRDITERESGLLRAKGMLENKARLAAGQSLLPGPYLYVGEGESGGVRVPFVGGRLRLGLPEGTLPKTLLIKAFGSRVPLAEPTPAGSPLGPLGESTPGGSPPWAAEPPRGFELKPTLGQRGLIAAPPPPAGPSAEFMPQVTPANAPSGRLPSDAGVVRLGGRPTLQIPGSPEARAAQAGEVFKSPLGSLSAGAGEMERSSPLFQGSEASGQREMFAPVGLPQGAASTLQASEPMPAAANRPAVATADYLERLLRHRERSDLVQQTVENLEDAPSKPIMDEFWSRTFPALDERGQANFLRQVKGQIGLQPGDTIGTDAQKRPIVAGDWKDITDFGGASVEDLDQNEQAVVGLAKLLNDHAPVPASHGPLGQPEIGAPAAGGLQTSALSAERPQMLTGAIPGGITEVPTASLRINPERFQFKRDVGLEGAGGKLKQSPEYDPFAGGVLSVWRDPADGVTYVVNGHHRFDLARRLGQETVPVRHIEADSAEGAMVRGAIQNIREGQGTAVDAAKIFRMMPQSAGEVARMIGLADAKVDQAVALSKLSEPIWRKVYTGKVPENVGITIGELVEGPEAQESALKMVESKGQNLSDDEIRYAIRFAKGAPSKMSEQAGLFGREQLKQSLAIEKAQLANSVMRTLGSEKSIFSAVARGSEAIKARGVGEVNQAEARSVAQNAARSREVFDKLADKTGPIGEALDDAAKRLAKGENAGKIKRELYQTVIHEVAQSLGRGGT